MIKKIIPIAASITLIGSASLTAYADMVLSISLDTFYSNKNYVWNYGSSFRKWRCIPSGSPCSSALYNWT